MKVLIGVRRLDKGGAELLECRLAQYLNQQGVEAHLLAQYNQQQFNGENASHTWNLRGIPRIYFFNSKNNIGIVKCLFNLFLLIKKEKYDLVISTNSGLDTIIGIIKLFVRFKQVIAFHTYINPSILNHYRIKLWAFFVKKADAYYSITDYVRNNVIELLKIDASKNRTIYNSIDADVLKQTHLDYSMRRDFSLPDDAKIILVAGRIEARKGFDLVVEYLQDLLVQKNVYLVVVGEGYEGNSLEEGLDGFVSTFRKKVKLLGIEKNVLFTGYRHDLYLLMKQADLYVHLARHEGFGLVLLEAIAAKIPIIGSNIGGIPEALKDTPYVPFDLDDKAGILEEALRLLNMDGRAKQEMVEKAYEVLDFYKDDRRAREVKELLERVII